MRKILPLGLIPSMDLYVIHSETAGVISSHSTATEAVGAFALHAATGSGSDAAIYARQDNCWHLF